MKHDITFTLLSFFTANDFIDADSWLLNSTTILVFLGSKHSSIFPSISLNFVFLLLDFSKNSTTQAPHPFYFQNIIFLSHMSDHFYPGQIFSLKSLKNLLFNMLWRKKCLNVSSLKIVVNFLIHILLYIKKYITIIEHLGKISFNRFGCFLPGFSVHYHEIFLKF